MKFPVARLFVLLLVACVASVALARQSGHHSPPPPGLATITLTCSPNAVTNGSTTTATLSTTVTAAQDYVFNLSSSDTSVAQVPAQATIANGTTSTTFNVTTSAIASDTSVTITADAGAGNSATTSLTVHSSRVASVSFGTGSVIGGNNVTATVTLDSPAATGGDPINFHTSDSSLIVPGSLSFPAGQTTANFVFATKGVDSSVAVTFGVSRQNAIQNTTITINPAFVVSCDVLASSITGGSQDTIVVHLNGKAGPSGLALTTTSNNTSVIPSPTGVSVPAQASQTTYRVTSNGVSDGQVVTIHTQDSLGRGNFLAITVLPGVLKSFTLSPATVYGGLNVVATVAITAPAGAGGASVALDSSSSAVDSGSGTIPANQTYAYIPMSTSAVDASTVVTVTAQVGVSSMTASVTIAPGILSALKVQSNPVVGGVREFGEAYLNVPCGPTQVPITLTSSNTSVVAVPSTVYVQPRKIGVLFPINTGRVVQLTTVDITATYGGVTKTIHLVVTP